MAVLTDTEIANLGLSRAGSKKRISSLDDQTSDAKLVNSLYNFKRDQLLRMFPWNFSERAVALAEVSGDAMIGWTCQYRYPADCAYARVVCDEMGARQKWYEIVPGQIPVQWLQSRIPFKVSSDDNGRLILTDLPEAYLLYSAKIEDTSLFDEAFTSVLAWWLAMDLIVPMHGSDRNKVITEQGFIRELSQAFSLSANEGVPDARPESPSITARM